jgi:Probable zinc-ribbon domain
MKRPVSPPSVPANPENWSEASKRSGTYDFPPTEYTDHKYNCTACSQPSLFTAEEQRKTYEERKAYIWQRRTLCQDCFRARLEVEAELDTVRLSWGREHEALQRDKKFLRRWVELLELHARYGARRDTGNEKMIRKLLGQNEA